MSAGLALLGTPGGRSLFLRPTGFGKTTLLGDLSILLKGGAAAKERFVGTPLATQRPVVLRQPPQPVLLVSLGCPRGRSGVLHQLRQVSGEGGELDGASLADDLAAAVHATAARSGGSKVALLVDDYDAPVTAGSKAFAHEISAMLRRAVTMHKAMDGVGSIFMVGTYRLDGALAPLGDFRDASLDFLCNDVCGALHTQVAPGATYAPAPPGRREPSPRVRYLWDEVRQMPVLASREAKPAADSESMVTTDGAEVTACGDDRSHRLLVSSGGYWWGGVDSADGTPSLVVPGAAVGGLSRPHPAPPGDFPVGIERPRNDDSARASLNCGQASPRAVAQELLRLAGAGGGDAVAGAAATTQFAMAVVGAVTKFHPLERYGGATLGGGRWLPCAGATGSEANGVMDGGAADRATDWSSLLLQAGVLTLGDRRVEIDEFHTVAEVQLAVPNSWARDVLIHLIAAVVVSDLVEQPYRGGSESGDGMRSDDEEEEEKEERDARVYHALRRAINQLRPTLHGTHGTRREHAQGPDAPPTPWVAAIHDSRQAALSALDVGDKTSSAPLSRPPLDPLLLAVVAAPTMSEARVVADGTDTPPSMVCATRWADLAAELVLIPMHNQTDLGCG